MDGLDNAGCTECTRFLPCAAHRDPRGANILLLPSREPVPVSPINAKVTFPAAKKPLTPAILHCPKCGAQHVEKGKWATFDHPQHLCYACGAFFPDPKGASVGVAQLPKEPTA
jgi:hypothetical protein